MPLDSVVSPSRIQLIASHSCGIWLLDPNAAQIYRWSCQGRPLAPLASTDQARRRFREPSLIVPFLDTVAVWDLFLQQVTLFDAQGRFLGAREHDVRRVIHGFVRWFSDPAFSRICTERRPTNDGVTNTDIVLWNKSSFATWISLDSVYGAPLLRISLDSASLEIPTIPTLRPYCFVDSRGRFLIVRNTEPVVHTYGVDGIRADTIQALLPRPIHTPTAENIADVLTNLSSNDSSMRAFAYRFADVVGVDMPTVDGSVYFEHAALGTTADEIWILSYRNHKIERRFTILAMDGVEWTQGTAVAGVVGDIVDFAVHPSFLFVLESERASELRLRAFARPAGSL